MVFAMERFQPLLLVAQRLILIHGVVLWEVALLNRVFAMELIQ